MSVAGLAATLRRGGAAVVAVVALGCVLTGWLEQPRALHADEAVRSARHAFAHAGLHAQVDDAAAAGRYDPRTGGSVAVWRTIAILDGTTVSVYLRQSDAAAVYIDDRSPDGSRRLLSDAQFTAFVRGVDNPVRRDLVQRDLAATVAAAAILALAVLLGLAPTRKVP